jgi:glutamate--cysteine ligase
MSIYLFDQVPVTGLKTPFRDGYVRDLAEEVLKLAKVDDFP